ncbi:hypothetical protein ILUMI_01744 [Ignelater luminosus]|uniref:Transposase n=1 Tax=Ignelater luminosus TaxID=2038154 RepID=A0A8K0DHW2_IGNLU|nr:hypothetical protein ILUMI_01744 [Ignelater luminosus]
MPPNKLYRKCSPEDIGRAIAVVKSGKSVAFAINCRIGAPTILTQAEEQHLVHWLLNISDAGFPATRTQLFNYVQILVKKLKRPNSFKNVHRDVNGLTARSQLTEEKIRSWFHEIRSYIDSKDLSDIFDDPRRIYNADETAFFLAPKGIKCLMRKDDKTAYNFISNEDKECLTCLITANAAGTILPPMVLFSYERIPSQIASLMPKGWAIGKSNSGCMTGQKDNLSDSLSESVNQPDKYINVQNEINHNLDETQSSDTDVRIKSTDKIIDKQSTPPVTPGPSNKIVVIQDIVKPGKKTFETNISSSVPPPFKSALFWPRQITPKTHSEESCSSSIDILLKLEEGDDWDMKQDFDEDSESDTNNDSDVERLKRETNNGIIKAMDYAGVSPRNFVILQFVYNKDTKTELFKKFEAQVENISDDKIS